MKRQFPSKISFIKVREIQVDPRYQRPLDKAFVKRISANFDAIGFGIPVLSKREDGTFWVIDGQHRIAACLLLGWSDSVIQCQVFEGMGINDEAEEFRKLNESRSVNHLARFIAAVVAGRQDETEIMKIVRAAGRNISRSSTDMRCVSSLLGTYRRKSGPKVLHRVLAIMNDAYGKEELLIGEIVDGLGKLLSRYDGQIEDARMTSKLAKRGGGQAKILGDARGLRAVNGSTVAVNVCEVIRGEWNKGISEANKLPPFRTSE